MECQGCYGVTFATLGLIFAGGLSGSSMIKPMFEGQCASFGDRGTRQDTCDWDWNIRMCENKIVTYLSPFEAWLELGGTTKKDLADAGYDTAPLGPFSCPYPMRNTIFRTATSVLMFLYCATVIYLVCGTADKGYWRWFWACAVGGILAGLFFANFILDADRLTAGNGFCGDDFKITHTNSKGNVKEDALWTPGSDYTIQCRPWLLAVPIVGDFLLAGLASALLKCVWNQWADEDHPADTVTASGDSIGVDLDHVPTVHAKEYPPGHTDPETLTYVSPGDVAPKSPNDNFDTSSPFGADVPEGEISLDDNNDADRPKNPFD